LVGAALPRRQIAHHHPDLPPMSDSSPAVPSADHDLVFSTLPGQEGPVFLRRHDALELAGVHAVVHESETWGAFRRRLAPDRWLQVVAGFRALGDDAQIPPDDAPLEGIPGHDDGDWPGWGAARMLDWVPASVRAFGVSEMSVFNGPGLVFRDEDTAAIVAAFEREGYRCERDHALVCAASDYAVE
jgi:hypothetical protein